VVQDGCTQDHVGNAFRQVGLTSRGDAQISVQSGFRKACARQFDQFPPVDANNLGASLD
jgi:hypothetical protein